MAKKSSNINLVTRQSSNIHLVTRKYMCVHMNFVQFGVLVVYSYFGINVPFSTILLLSTTISRYYQHKHKLVSVLVYYFFQKVQSIFIAAGVQICASTCPCKVYKFSNRICPTLRIYKFSNGT